MNHLTKMALGESSGVEIQARLLSQHWQAGSSRLPSSRVMLPAYAGGIDAGS